MNELLLNITVAFRSEEHTAENMADILQEHGLIEVLRTVMHTNSNAISVAAFKGEEAKNRLGNLYTDTTLNLWAED